MVLDAIEYDLATKTDILILKEEMSHRFDLIELKIVNKLGRVVVCVTSIALAVLAWLIKI